MQMRARECKYVEEGSAFTVAVARFDTLVAVNSRIERPAMEGWSTWSGRERSSHSRFPPVPRVGLVTFLFLLFAIPRVFSRAPFCLPPRFIWFIQSGCTVFSPCGMN